MSATHEVWKTKELGQRYLEGVRGALPFAAEQIELILRLTRHTVPEVRHLLDLGCGDGILGRALLDDYPDAHGVFLDFSESMMAAVRQKLRPADNRATLVTQDYSMPAWVETVRGNSPFDVIVSGLSIHHQPDTRKRAIYQELFDLLSPGGLFLNLEHVASATPRIEGIFDEYFIDALWKYHGGLGTTMTREQIAEQYHHRADKAANILAPVEEQCRWLHDLGFQDVDCYFKIFELALFGGRKPGSPTAGKA
jgi:tRNA (cmo5U34)-methyltransferase